MIANLRTTKCECGFEFSEKDVKSPLLTTEVALGVKSSRFYGGNVNRCSKAVCPSCAIEYMLYLKQLSHSWKVLDMQIINKPKKSYATLEPELLDLANEQIEEEEREMDLFLKVEAFKEETKAMKSPDLKQMCIEIGIPVTAALMKREFYLEKLIATKFGVPVTA